MKYIIKIIWNIINSKLVSHNNIISYYYCAVESGSALGIRYYTYVTRTSVVGLTFDARRFCTTP